MQYSSQWQGPRLPRVLDLTCDRLWVVSDIHGNLAHYQQIVHDFKQEQQKAGAAASIKLLFLGDVVHGYTSDDGTMAILLDLMQRNDPDVLCLLGNHELMHVYHLDMYKAGSPFCQQLEACIAEDRSKFVELFMRFPVAACWQNILLQHVGASAVFKTVAGGRDFVQFLHEWSHLQTLRSLVKECGYSVHDLLSTWTPAFGACFLASELGANIRQAFFSKNELEYGTQAYRKYLEVMLRCFNNLLPERGTPLEWVVTGHIAEQNGYNVIGHQLRICSSHGSPLHGKILKLDSAKTYNSMSAIVQCLDSSPWNQVLLKREQNT